MGYFKSETPGKSLNVTHSITATVHSGGIPSCEFFTRKKIRTLLILEDAYAEALDWNPVPKELAEGMNKFGIPVIYGKFRGSPDKFKIQDGSVFHLDDLEDHSNGIVMLIFTDGKSFQGLKKSFSLEAIARWPMVAWMDLRAQRFWDESSDLAIQYKIPIFPATAAGLVQAIQVFLTEQGLRDKSTEATNENKYLPNIYNKKPELWVEHFLGDALLWAQDCSMIQPISSSMAQKLREKFYPHLSADEIECLHALPNTTPIESNIHFSDDMLKVLRNGFMLRKSEDEQNQVIFFILDQIEAAKPDAPEDSLAYLSWESIKERVRLEMGTDDDLERFGELLNSPLGESISDKLDNYGYSDDKISMRESKSKKAKERLAKVCGNPLGINLISRMHKLCFAIVLFSFIVSFLGLILIFNKARLTKNEFQVNFRYKEIPIKHYFLELWNGNEWEPETDHDSSRFFKLKEPSKEYRAIVIKNNKSKYRLLLYGNNYYTTKEFVITDRFEIDLYINTKDVVTECIEEYPKMGLTIFRCSEKMSITDGSKTTTSWKNRLPSSIMLQNRNMSVGIEFINKKIENSELINFRNTLLETSSVDIIFQIYTHNPDEQQKALLRLKKEVFPYISNSQLVVWGYGLEYDLVQLNKFESILNLGDISSWIHQLQKIFEPDVNIAVSEEEILNKLVNAQALGKGQPVVLFRPELIKKEIDVTSKTVPEDSGPELIKKEFALTVKTVPEDARVRIMNIRPVYQDGILLTPGRYDIKVSSQGYGSFRKWVEIEREDKTIEVVLEKQTGYLVVKAEPTFASIHLEKYNGDSKKTIKNNKKIELSMGEWIVSVKAKGYESIQKKIDINKGKEIEVKFKLNTVSNEFSAIEWKTLNFKGDTVAFYSPSGKYFAALSHGDRLVLYDRFYNELGIINKLTSSGIIWGNSLAFSPDEKYLAFRRKETEKEVIIAIVPKLQILQTFSTHSDYVNSVSFSPNGKYLASGSEDDTIKIWKLSSEKFSEIQTLKGHSDNVYSVSFSPD